MESATQAQTLNKAVYILHHTNALRKGMNPSILCLAMSKKWDRFD